MLKYIMACYMYLLLQVYSRRCSPVHPRHVVSCRAPSIQRLGGNFPETPVGYSFLEPACMVNRFALGDHRLSPKIQHTLGNFKQTASCHGAGGPFQIKACASMYTISIGPYCRSSVPPEMRCRLLITDAALGSVKFLPSS